MKKKLVNSEDEIGAKKKLNEIADEKCAIVGWKETLYRTSMDHHNHNRCSLIPMNVYECNGVLNVFLSLDENNGFRVRKKFSSTKHMKVVTSLFHSACPQSC